MRFVFYTHSLVSDWNHGNAHFLRGVMRALAARGHQVRALEPRNGWSRANLLAEHGRAAVDRFADDFPGLRSDSYTAGQRHEDELVKADVVVVHEWTDPALIARLGRARAQGGRFVLLFHDTHHRAVSARDDIAELDLSGYDGILAFGASLRDRYLRAGWGNQVYVWHEAADDALFRPVDEAGEQNEGELIWVGNWGDGERTRELETFLIGPTEALGLKATVHGVRYPTEALARLSEAGIDYRGWIANADVPCAFARHLMTVHVPRRPYVESLPGIPTIRMFEALACGIPLVSAPWRDTERLFVAGEDYLIARTGEEMTAHLRALREDPDLRRSLAASGLKRIRERHTCRHRASELLTIARKLAASTTSNETGPGRELA